MKIKIKFEPRDIWIGVYWTTNFLWTRKESVKTVKIYICIIPCLPIILYGTYTTNNQS